MLKELISKEFFNNLYNLRFIVGIILCVFLTVSCVIILTYDYKKELEDYNYRISIQNDFLEKYAHTNRMGSLIQVQKPPEKFRPLIIGISKDAELGSFDDNPLSVLFPPLDFLFIITIIVSLMAIMFSYDSISGEREQGTLKLMASYSHSRAKILFSKWIGGLLSLLVPFSLSLLIGGIFIAIHPAIFWDISDWASFALLLLTSIIFTSIFYLLGLMVSSFTNFSSTSIITSLFLWVLFILVVPNISPYISAQLYRIPSVNKIEREVNRLLGIERDELGRTLSRAVTQKYKEKYGNLFGEYISMNKASLEQRLKKDETLKTMHETYRKEFNDAWSEANRIQGEKAEKIRKELDSKSAKQNIIAKNLACISPYSNFMYIATDLTGTGLHGLDYFERFSGQYYITFHEYLSKKTREASQKNPTFDSNSFIDISDRPRFSFKEEPLNYKLKTVLPYLGILIFFNFLFFILAFIKFMKYDVR
jgi:ABC-type transport system involved in multi-copper enzyme maturation permease subunit